MLAYLMKSLKLDVDIFSDMGVMNSDGTILIKGRTSDAMRFKVFAKVVYPAPIEESFGGHPCIKDISVRTINL